MAIGDVWRLSVEATVNQNMFVHVLHYRTSISIGAVESEPEALAESFVETCVPALLPIATEDYLLTSINVRGVTHEDLGYDRPVMELGTRTGERVPPQLSPLVLKKTAKIGRRNMGRISLPPPTEADVNGGSLSTGYKDDAAAYLNSLFTLDSTGFLTGYRFNLVVYSKKYDTSEPVTYFRQIDQIRTQRRRMFGIGG